MVQICAGCKQHFYKITKFHLIQKAEEVEEDDDDTDQQ